MSDSSLPSGPWSHEGSDRTPTRPWRREEEKEEEEVFFSESILFPPPGTESPLGSGERGRKAFHFTESRACEKKGFKSTQFLLYSDKNNFVFSTLLGR